MKFTTTSIFDLSKSLITYVQRDEEYFLPEYHAHPEFELVYIQQGRGKKIIGNSITAFEEDELVLIGANLPHVWLSDKAATKKYKRSRAIAVYFDLKIFSENFFEMPESKELKHLFSYAERGIIITGDTKKEALIKLKKLSVAGGLNKIICLLDLLNTVASQEQVDCIDHVPARHPAQASERLTNIFEYINSNLRKKIALKDVAKLVNLTPQSLCRYFKQKTGKSFIDYLHETRIFNAKNLLLTSDLTVAEIAYKSGFRTASDFNKLFKKITGFSPTKFRKAGV